VDGQIQDFLVNFYPIIRDFPQWLQVLLDRSPGRRQGLLSATTSAWKSVTTPLWRAMGDGFNVPKERFQIPEPMIPEVEEFHGYLTEMGRSATFGAAVSATNYAVEGVAQKISEKGAAWARQEREDRGRAGVVARGACEVRRRASDPRPRDHQGLREAREAPQSVTESR